MKKVKKEIYVRNSPLFYWCAWCGGEVKGDNNILRFATKIKGIDIKDRVGQPIRVYLPDAGKIFFALVLTDDGDESYTLRITTGCQHCRSAFKDAFEKGPVALLPFDIKA